MHRVEGAQAASVPDSVSTLRVLDAALWMSLGNSVHVRPFCEITSNLAPMVTTGRDIGEG